MTQTANRMRSKHFKLGTFSSNCSGGMSITNVPERWKASWDENLALARMVDEAGLDFMLPVARWIGYRGGPSNFQSGVLETMTWAAGLLASTRNIAVIATVHAAAFNPVVAAKQIVTLDQIGHGRAGLNIVAGWNKPEFDALGLNLPDDHESRYAHAQEWFDVLKKLWTSTEPFDFDGSFFRLRGVWSDPLPFNGLPPIINAAGSAQGRAFATRNADYLFTPAIDLARSAPEIEQLKGAAQANGREVEVLTFSHVVCRPTEAEAKAYLQHYAHDYRDVGTLEEVIALQFAHAHSFPHDLLTLIKDRFAAGHGGYPLIGTPEQVADGICALHETGFAGTTLSFVDYVAEFPFFRDNVLPLLEARGLRISDTSSARAPALVG
ncbi:MAG TPA: LLM class flavin-dependent oxidoreductase [Novosphingobium sp.]|nr:LLM class flavin-dependent oxidoreductase [Novosphingobium sp.]